MIGSYLSVLRRRALLVALVTALVAPLAFLALTAGGRSYQSVAVVQVGSRLAAGVVGLDTPYEDAETLLATEVQFFEGDRVAEAARTALAAEGWSGSAEELSAQVTATGRGLSNLMDVTGTASTPERARQLTDAFVTAYVQTRQDSQRDAVQAVVDDLEAQRDQAEAQLAALDSAPAGAAAERDRASAQSWYDSLTDQIERARLRLSVDTSGVALVSPASAAARTESTGAPLAALLSLAGALLVGCGAALVLDMLRDPVRTRAEAQELLAAPVLGVLGAPGAGAGVAGGAAAAAARGVRLRLEHLNGGTAPRTVAVTALPSDAADAVRVATSLAAAWGRTGLRVALIADPSAEAVRTAAGPLPPDGDGGEVGAGLGAAQTSLPGVWLVPSTTSEARTGFSDHPSPDAVLSALRRSCDVVVLVDTRPEAPDTAAVASLVDAVLVVCALDVTPSKQVTALTRSLEQYGVRVDGVVLTRRGPHGQHRRPGRAAAAGAPGAGAVPAAAREDQRDGSVVREALPQAAGSHTAGRARAGRSTRQ
ncbi:hypothetical protein [Kineococcus gypseus]|uniref:hypothetical protein n=1 Tax=Kineococcus gypseus TaxID=1637102 RepID=UPI003D7D518E